MSEQPRKAHREPMVWLVFGLPALVVIAGIATLVIAIRHRDGGDVNDAVSLSLIHISEPTRRS